MSLRARFAAAAVCMICCGLTALCAQEADDAQPLIPAEAGGAAPKAETPKVETPKAEARKVETPTAETPKPAAPVAAPVAKPEPAAPQAASGEVTADLDVLKEQLLKKCEDTVQADVLQFMVAAFNACEASARGEAEVIGASLENKKLVLARIRALESKVKKVANELAALDQKRAALEARLDQQRQAFAAGGPAPSEVRLQELDEFTTRIAMKKTAQHQALAAYYRLPRASKVQNEIAALMQKADAAKARQERWAQEAARASEVLARVNAMPKTIPLRKLIASGLKLEEPACDVSEHWLAEGSKFNMFIVQMPDGQIMGAATDPDQAQVYDVSGFVYGKKVSLMLMNKHDKRDVLEYRADVETDPATGKAKRLQGMLKREGDTGEGTKLAFR